MHHRLPNALLSREIVIHVAGAGGNGAQFVNGLARLHMSMKALGHPGFLVGLCDPDHVTEPNIGRQLFSPSDIGQNKASVIINRLNAFYALQWRAFDCNWGEEVMKRTANETNDFAPDFVIGCVDSMASRRSIEAQVERFKVGYWLDMGNDSKTGQIILGSYPGGVKYPSRLMDDRDPKNKPDPQHVQRLPNVMDLFPAMRNKRTPEDKTPSCSLAGALQRQDLFVNQEVATQALNLLWQFFRNGKLDHHGVFVNLEHSMANPLPIDPQGWKRFGFDPGRKGPLVKIKKVLRQPRPFGRPGKFLLRCGHIAYGTGKVKCRCPKCPDKPKGK